MSEDRKDIIGHTGKIDNEVFARLAAEKRKKIEELLRGVETVQSSDRGGINRNLLQYGLDIDEYEAKNPMKSKVSPLSREVAKQTPLTRTEKAQQLGIILDVKPVDELVEEVKIYDATLPLDNEIIKPATIEKTQNIEKVYIPEPTDLDTHEILRMARKEKISTFVLSSLEIPDEDERDSIQGLPEDDRQEAEGIFEYLPGSDPAEIVSALRGAKSRKLVQIIITVMLAIISLGIVFASKLPIKLLPFSFESATQPGAVNSNTQEVAILTGILLFIAVVTFIVNIDAMGEGARNFVRLSASQESGALIVWIACIIQGVLVIIDNDALIGGPFGLFLPFSIIAILLAQVGSMLRQSRELNSFKVISNKNEKYHLRLQNIEDSTMLERPKGEADCATAVYIPADFSSDFFAMSETEDLADRNNRIMVPVVIVIALVVGLIAWLTKNQKPEYFITAFTAVNCAVMPIASAIISNLPQSRAAKANMVKGIAISNQCAYDDAADATSLLISDEELFPKGSVLLHGIKTFDGKRMDEAIVVAASAVEKHGGPLKHMFASILSENEESYLLEVDAEAVYEPERGLISWILGKRVLLGSREFMQEYSMNLPEKDYETKFLKKGYSCIYLALGGDLMAMFVVSYHINDKVVSSLRSLSRKGMKFLIDSRDFSISAKLVARQLKIPTASVVILNNDGKSTAERVTTPAAALKSGVVCTGGIAARADAMSSCFKLRKMITAGFVLEAGFLIVALIINLMFILFGEYTRINFTFLFIYQMIWLFATVLIQMSARYKHP